VKEEKEDAVWEGEGEGEEMIMTMIGMMMILM
jgi:hypothetical protein